MTILIVYISKPIYITSKVYGFTQGLRFKVYGASYDFQLQTG